MGIGPSSRETTLHHFRDPLLDLVSKDSSFNLVGVLIAGTPEIIKDKLFIASRSGSYATMMDVDGVIISIDSWGNSHVDFTEHIRAIGELGIPVVGMSFVGNQASFVVKNEYMDGIVDFNKNDEGIETLIVGQNTVVESDVKIALGLLKSKLKRKNRPVSIRRKGRAKHLGKLRKEYYEIKEVKLSSKTNIEENILYLNEKIFLDKEIPKEIEKVKMNIIDPKKHNVDINCILDFTPIATKIEGKLGTGTTRIIEGVVVMPTGVDVKGVQPANIGSSEGILKERVMLNRAGTPGIEDYIIHIDIVLKEGEARTRKGIMAAHYIADLLIDEIRRELKKVDERKILKVKEYNDYLETGKPRILIIKLVSGLGNMYETVVFPKEPGGFIGGDSIMSYGNLHIPMSPNEYRDGGVHSLT